MKKEVLHPLMARTVNISSRVKLTITKFVCVKEAIYFFLGLHLLSFLGVQKVSTFVIKD